MSQDSTIPNSNYHTMVVLGDAAWTLLANQPIDQIDIDSFKKLHNFEDERSNSPFIAFSNEFEIGSLDLKRRFQVL